MLLLDLLECLEAGDARHMLVEYHQIVVRSCKSLNGVGSGADGGKFIPLAFQKHYVGPEHVDLVVGPEYSRLAVVSHLKQS